MTKRRMFQRVATMHMARISPRDMAIVSCHVSCRSKFHVAITLSWEIGTGIAI
jgi:hypothetical protein